MSHAFRRFFPWIIAAVALLAVVWAASFDSLDRAEFAFQNGDDIKTLDPARATGSPEGRVLNELYEGLLKMMPVGEADPETGLVAMEPLPGMAEAFDVSDDGLTYTFRLRDGARWTNGDPVTAHDFAWSWQRMLHPETANEYAFLLNQVPGAEAYHAGTVEVGDRVEVELWDRPEDAPGGKADIQPFPRGTVLHGILREIRKPPEPELPEEMADEEREDALAAWREQWVHLVEVLTPAADGTIDWDGSGELQAFARAPSTPAYDGPVTQCHWVLVAFDRLGGVEVADERTLVVNLESSVPYFPNLVAFYPLYPVNRRCVEEHGVPLWTKADNIVTNGPYRLAFRRLRDRLRLEKNPDYWNAENVGLNTIDVMSINGQTTALNMYENGQLHWVTDPPTNLLDVLKEREDFVRAPQLSVYFYRLNTERPPLDDVRVRRALAMAIDREEIVNEVAKAGQQPAYTIVPPGLAGYEPAEGFEFNPERARELLAEAGYPGGRGMPKMTVLYNTSEGHRAIAEVIQQQVRNHLNVSLGLQNMEWGTFLDKINALDYQIGRAGWIADYPDPNTFLDMWVSGGPQNSTGWSNDEFDQLIEDAAREQDPDRRMEMLREAEQTAVDEMPIIPIYFYVSVNMVKPEVEGFYPSAQDLHPLQLIRLKPTE